MPGGRGGLSDSAVWCCGCAEWSPAMSYGGGDVQPRAFAMCVQELQELAFFVPDTTGVTMHRWCSKRVGVRHV